MNDFGLAARLISRKPAESILALLGVALATAAMAATLSLIGSYDGAERRLSGSPMARQIRVMSVSRSPGSGEAGIRLNEVSSEPVFFSLADSDRILADCPDVGLAYVALAGRMSIAEGPDQTERQFGQEAPTGSDSGAVAHLAETSEPVLLERVEGMEVTPDFFAALGMAAREGLIFGDRDLVEGRRVAAIGAGLATRIFADGKVLGRKIRLDDSIYTIEALLSPYPVSDGVTISFDDRIYIPLRSFVGRARGNDLVSRGMTKEFSFSVREGGDLSMATKELEVAFGRIYGEGRARAVDQLGTILRDIDSRTRPRALLALPPAFAASRASIVDALGDESEVRGFGSRHRTR
jgi:putative ABC transport system permease protein